MGGEGKEDSLLLSHIKNKSWGPKESPGAGSLGGEGGEGARDRGLRQQGLGGPEVCLRPTGRKEQRSSTGLRGLVTSVCRSARERGSGRGQEWAR